VTTTIYGVISLVAAGLLLASLRRIVQRRRWQSPAMSKAELVRRGWKDERL
jgi:hypothetical protein